MKKKLIIFILCIFFINTNYVFAIDIKNATNYNIFDVNLELSSKNVILYDLTDNYILYNKESDTKVQTASLTKIMTALVVIENIENLDKEVVINSEVFEGISEYSKVGFKIGDKVTYKDLLYGVLLPSGADAVNALVLNVSGEKEKFIKLMNEKANSLGLTSTHFDNAIGMDSKDNYSTAHDMAIILNYALSNKKFKEIFTTKKYTIEKINLTMYSTLINYGKNFDTSIINGAKSGYTDGAGVCLASTSKINEKEYLLIVLGANPNNRANAIKDSINIYNYFDKNYEEKVILDKDYIIKKINIKWGKKKKYNITSNKDITKYIKKSITNEELEYKYKGINELKYNIKKGEKLGTVSIVYKDNIIATENIYLNEKISYYHPVIYTIIGVSSIVMIMSLKKIRKNKKRKRKKRRKK